MTEGMFDPMVEQHPKWHPILAAEEREPGVWVLADTLGWEYGRITILRRNGSVCYRMQFRPKTGDISSPGYERTLRAACERLHGEFVKSGQPAARIGWEKEVNYPRK